MMLNKATTWPGVKAGMYQRRLSFLMCLKPTPLSPVITTPALPVEEGRVMADPQ